MADDVWVVQTICCGRDMGIVEFPPGTTWEQADAFRREYADSYEGHERVGILKRKAKE